MHINKLKNLSRNNIIFLLDNLKYKLENQQNLYYDRDDDTIVLSGNKFLFKCKCNASSTEKTKIILEMPSYKDDPVEIYNEINKNTNHFTGLLYSLSELMAKHTDDLGL